MKSQIIFAYLFLIQAIAFSQNNKVDSLIHLLKSDQKDTNQLINLYSISDECETIGDYSNALTYGQQALSLADELLKKGDNRITHTVKRYKGKTYNNIGIVYADEGNYPQALKTHQMSLRIREELNDKKGIAGSRSNIGMIYIMQGNYPEALKNYLNALKMQEAIGDKRGCAISYNSIGIIYKGEENLPEALKNYHAALKIWKELDDKNGASSTYNNIAIIYKEQGKYNESLENHYGALKIAEKIGDKRSAAIYYGNIGAVFQDIGKYNDALENHLKSLKMREEIGEKHGVVASLLNIGIVQMKLGDLSEAEKNIKNGISKSKEIGIKNMTRDGYGHLAILDSMKGNFKGAYENHKLYMLYKDSLNNEETQKQTIQNQMTFEFEKKEAIADAEHKTELRNQEAIAEEKNRKQKLITTFVICGLLVVLIFAIFIFNRFKVTQKQKQIIELKEKETLIQKHIIEEKHKEITDSINYAERIQRSFIASKELLDTNLKDYFVFFNPKDVVSGDFYWGSKLKNGKFALVTADSTGHGVPGAIMSLLNITSLERAIENHVEPAEIFNATRLNIIERLKKDGSEQGGKDGMDASITVYNFESRSLTIAAANNPVWLIRNKELIEFKADKMPVGKHDRDQEGFHQNKFELQQGDVVYTLTDGFPDQFGGPKGKKFMTKQLKETLTEICHLPMAEQKGLLENIFNNWKGNSEQVDDVLIIGVRI